MRSAIGRGFTATVGTTLAGITLALLPGTAQADEPSWEDSRRIVEYSRYLSLKSHLGDIQAEETAQGFAALSSTQQVRFLDLLEDRSLMQRFFEENEAPPSVTGTTRVEMADGDVVVEHESLHGVDETSLSEEDKAAGKKDMWARYKVTDKIFGIEVAQVLVKTNYQVKGKDTLKVYPGSASHFLFMPACDFTHSPVKEWVTSPPGDNALTETVWSADCWGSEWDRRERVWADYRGFLGGYLKTD
ncbi:hypothetical protein [Streptomyces cadmiisoli]|uniref:hypothetical protein n=1 Tax=Streptomyces cadmiisoli TaxID=2184053 RepID=UPI003655F5E3